MPDYALLKLFFIVTLWRAHCSRHAFYRRVDLRKAASRFATRIRNADAGNSDDSAVVLATFDHAYGQIHLDPHPERYGSIKVYRFYLGVYVAYIKVDSRPFKDPFRQYQISPGRKVTVIVRDFSGSQEAAIVQDIVRKTEARRKS